MSQNSTSNNSTVAAQQVTDAALVSNLIISLILAVLFFILYLISKHFRPKLYQVSDAKPPSQWSVMFKSVFCGPLHPILYTHGMDVFTYLHFLRMCFKIIIVLSIFGFIVIMPINATGTNKYKSGSEQVSGTSILSMANIDPDDNLRLGFNVLAVIFNSFVCCFFLYLFLREFVKYRVKHKRLNLVENYTVGITGFDPNKWNQERLLQFFTKLFPEQIYSLNLVPDVPKLDDLHERRYKLVLEKEAMVVKKRKAKGPTYVSKSVERLDKKIEKIDQKLQLVDQPKVDDEKVEIPKKDRASKKEKVRHFCSSSTESSPLTRTTNTAYATFQTMGDAHICSRVIITGIAPRWQVFPAPDPKEIYWRNYTPNVGSWSRNMLFLFGIIVTFFLIVFWIIPVAVATGLSNLQTIASIPGFGLLVTFIDFNSTIKSIVEGFLPQLIIIIFFIILLPLIDLIVNKTFLPLYRTEKIRSVIIVYFAFKIVNIYCAGLLTNSFWSIINQLETIVEEPVTLVNILGKAVPAQAIFFINFVVVAALTGTMLKLWKPGTLVSEGLGLCCLATTPRDYRELYRPEQFTYRDSIPDMIFILVVVLCYSNVQPLILPFGILYFFLLSLVETHRLNYVCRQKSLGGGLMWCTMFNMGCFGVGVYGVTMLGVFALKQFVAGVIISILVVVCVIVFACYMNQRWFPTAHFGSYASMVKHNRFVPASSDVFRNLYVRPSMLPVPPEQLEFYDDLDEVVEVNSNKKPLSPDNANLSEMNSETGTEPSQTKPRDEEEQRDKEDD